MEENFEDAEIGVAQFCPLDALLPRAGTALERLSLKRARHARRWSLASWSFLCRLISNCYLDTNYIDVNIL